MAELPDPQAFATIEDLTNFWKAPDNSNRANFLLSLASNRLRAIGQQVGVNVDQRHDDTVYASILQWVVMEAVKRALLTPTDAAPANAIQQTAGPYSSNIQFTNPSGDLWFKKSELSDLGLYGKQRLGSVPTTGADIYS